MNPVGADAEASLGASMPHPTDRDPDILKTLLDEIVDQPRSAPPMSMIATLATPACTINSSDGAGLCSKRLTSPSAFVV